MGPEVHGWWGMGGFPIFPIIFIIFMIVCFFMRKNCKTVRLVYIPVKISWFALSHYY